MRRKLFLTIAIILLLTLFACALAACGLNGKDGEEEEDPPKPAPTLTVNQAVDKIYSGLIAGGEEIASRETYGVKNVYTVFTSILNYTIQYKANYNKNFADSEIYISFFDNQAYMERLTLYFDGQDLYIVMSDNKYVLSDFSATMMFNVFFQFANILDMSSSFFGNQVGQIFDRENSSINLSVLLSQNNIDYLKVDENREVIELKNIDLSIINEDISLAMENNFRGIGDKFDLITQKYLNFKLSRLLNSRFGIIKADKIGIQMSDAIADYTSWEMSGTLQDASKYWVNAEVGYNDGNTGLSERANFVKNKFTETTVGKNDFTGSINIPSVSSEDYDVRLITNLNSVNNADNEMSFKITDGRKEEFISAYYRNEHAFLDIAGINNWLAGAVDISAFNLPKVGFDKIDITKLINAGYNNLVKVLLTIFDRGKPETPPGREDLYDIIMANFDNNGVDTVYYTVTEELIQKIREDDTSLMTMVADLLQVDESRLASFIGEDFFAKTEFILSYNLETGVIGLEMQQKDATIFTMLLQRKSFTGIDFPPDVYPGSDRYAKFFFPDVTTIELEAKLFVSNAKERTDISKILGALIGDPSGRNTVNYLSINDMLIIRGKMSESYSVNEVGETVTNNKMRLDIYRKVGQGREQLMVSVYTNPVNVNELLIGFYEPLGDYSNGENKGVFYRIDKGVLRESFEALPGEDNIFTEDNVFRILDILFNSEGLSAVSKIEGWFEFSILASADKDPVFDLIGIENTSLSVRARVFFTDIDLNDIDINRYVKPTVTPGTSITVESLYSDGSGWKNDVEVFIGDVIIHFSPTYLEDSIKVITGKYEYLPSAFLFGEEFTYVVKITSETGTYRIDRLKDETLILDPAYTKVLPDKIEVVYDNGQSGFLPCSFTGFFPSNITDAGYNQIGFVELSPDMASCVQIGKNSIMDIRFDVYILVHNRKVVGERTTNGELTPVNTDPTGVPIIGEITVDPYTYAMKKRLNNTYNPIIEGILRQNMQLLFDGTYGEEEQVVDGGTIMRDLYYDLPGVNRFTLADLELEWTYDFATKLTYQGSEGFAYAYYGDTVSGNAVKLAIRIIVPAQTVNSVKIDDEVSGTYTIDYLKKETYNIPSQSDGGHTVTLYFGNAAIVGGLKERIVTQVRPQELTDDEYCEKYIYANLSWGEPILDKMNVEGATALFGSDNNTFAEFGKDLGVGVQRVNLAVRVPSRYLGQNTVISASVATGCTPHENDEPTFTTTQVALNDAYFPATNNVKYGARDPFRFNPYDKAARLPQTIFINVQKSSGEGKEYIEYPVQWVTTGMPRNQGDAGEELNLIYEENGRFGLANPVTNYQERVVYGKVGNGNGFIWVTMRIANLASKFQSIIYEGLDAGQTTIEVDPYKSYRFPTAFDAVLENGEIISETGIEWYVSKEGENNYYPVNYIPNKGYDEKYYKDGKYVFSHKGGNYILRYIIESGGEIIRQELTLTAKVASRTVASDRVDVYNDGRQPEKGFAEINLYNIGSKTLFDRLLKIASGDRVAGIAFSEEIAGGLYRPYALHVDWLRASPTDANYANSLDCLISMFTESVNAGREIILNGTIGTGTVAEQTLQIRFSFANFVLERFDFALLANGLETEAVIVDEWEGGFDFNNILINGIRTLTFRLDKPYGLTANGKYATPYDYMTYVLSVLSAQFVNGNEEILAPEIDFRGMTADAFNNAVLKGTGDTVTEIKLLKLSAGSAEDEIIIVIHAKKDVRLTTSEQLTAEMFDEAGNELYGTKYNLPSFIDVVYELSGTVRYEISLWNVSPDTSAYIGTAPVDGITTEFINTLNPGGNNSKQPRNFNFYYRLPCMDANESYSLSVFIPKKNIELTHYSASGETDLFDIKEGVLHIKNPYLYYMEGSRFGLDTTKVPNIIDGAITTEYDGTAVNTHTVEWLFIEGVFTKENFSNGNEKILFATANLPAYYNEQKEKQNQTIELYLTVDAMTFDGISNGEMPVVTGSDGLHNMVQIDPYNDIMGYRGNFVLPKTITVNFNGGAVSYRFEEVTYSLRDKNGLTLANIVNIPYTEKGHSLTYDNLREDGILEIAMYIPGFDAGIKIFVNILSRIIEKVNVANLAYKNDGEVLINELPGIYYIDPYNNATFALPYDISVKFKELNNYSHQTVAGWDWFDETDGQWKELERSGYFYTQRSTLDDTVQYGYYRAKSDSYKGGNYRLRGYIALGRTSTGTVGRQEFEIQVIVLNRSMKTAYQTDFRFDDPMGGLLSDIPRILSQEMFVDYDKYYATLPFMAPEFYYSRFSVPSLPEVNWAVYNDQSVVDYNGGFDKEISGNIYVANKNIAAVNQSVTATVKARFEELTKARMWDSYFASVGIPMAYYSANTTVKLKELATRMENDVINATYELLVKRYDLSLSETDKQYGNYLTNGLVNEIVASLGLDLATQKPLIVEHIYKRLAAEYAKLGANDEKTARNFIYEDWKKLLDEFKSAGNDYSATLSAYQSIKVKYYNEANVEGNSAFTAAERVRYNAKNRESIEKSLRIYVNAEIWDKLYDRVAGNERERMNFYFRFGTIQPDIAKLAQAKSTALSLFINERLARTGSIGETATARISAPEFQIGNILDENGNILKEFYFNVYSAISFLTGVNVETVLNYASIYEKYVEEGIRKALEDYRDGIKDVSLTEFVKQQTAVFVNGMVPMVEIPNSGGQMKPLIGFAYDKYNPTANENTEYWNILYEYKENSATAHLDKLTGSDSEKWQKAYTAHQILGETEMVAAMDKIFAEVNADTTVVDKYPAAFVKYIALLKTLATKEMDVAMSEALCNINVNMVDRLMQQNVMFAPLLPYATHAQLFSNMFGDYAREAMDYLKNSYALGTAERTAVESALSTVGQDKGAALYNIMNNQTLPAVGLRAKDFFQFVLGGDKAYQSLYENASLLRLDKKDLDKLLSVGAEPGGSLTQEKYANAFTDKPDAFERFKNYLVFAHIQAQYQSNVDDTNRLNGWLNAAIRTIKASAFDTLNNYFVTNGMNPASFALIDIRKTNSTIERDAFNNYVKMHENMGNDVAQDMNSQFTQAAEESVRRNEERVYTALLEDGDFLYKHFLAVTAEEKPEYQARAAEFYYNDYASDGEKRVFDYYVAIYGRFTADVYQKILGRSDLGERFSSVLSNSYYRVILDSMLQKINQGIVSEVSGKTITELESIPQFLTLHTTYYNLIQNVCLDKNVSMGQLHRSAALELAKKTYIQQLFATATAPYEKHVGQIKANSRGQAAKDIYDGFYAQYGGILDAILNQQYKKTADNPLTAHLARLQYNAFNHLREDLLEEELTHYNSSVAIVSDAYASEKLYDELGIYNLSEFTSENVAQSLFDKWKTAYLKMWNSASAEEKSVLDTMIAPSAFERNSDQTYFDKLNEIAAIYAIVVSVNDSTVQTLLNGWLSDVSQASLSFAQTEGLERRLTEAIRENVGQELYYADPAHFDEALVSVFTAVRIVRLLNRLEQQRNRIDSGLWTDDNLAGVFTTTDMYFKQAYIGFLPAGLQALGLHNAKTLTEKELASKSVDFESLPEENPTYIMMEQEIKNRLQLTSEYEKFAALPSGTSLKNYVLSITSELDQRLARYKQMSANQTDAEYKKIFDAMMSDSEVIQKWFLTEDNLGDTANLDNRHILVFDKKSFVEGTQTETIAPIYVTNGQKFDTVEKNNGFKLDGMKYKFIQMTVQYVDFTGTTTVDNVATSQKANSLTIDPMSPVLPQTVQAYASYTPIGSSDAVLLDIGTVSVKYGDTFNDNIYNGQESDAVSYSIFLYDKRGNHNELVIKVDYLDRTVQSVYVEGSLYGGTLVEGDVNYTGFYNTSDGKGSNLLTVSPTNPELLDTVGKKYLLPQSVVALYNDGFYRYDDVVWDESRVKYSLDGFQNLQMRILSYSYTDTGTGTVRRVKFDYASNTVTIALYSEGGDVLLSQATYDNAPSYGIWNIKLTVTKQTVQRLDSFDKETGKTVVLGTNKESSTGNYIDVPKDVFSVNPFDILYPETVVIAFNDKSEITLDVDSWGLEPGSMGTYKLKDIILGIANDSYLMATFDYLGYAIRVRIVADEIRLEGLPSGEYIDGGTLYLVKNGGSVYDQLAQNYSYLHYNFSSIVSAPDWRKVPLSFIDSEISQISTSTTGSYQVKGVLGWDKKEYSDFNMSSNTAFTISVIDPVMYATLGVALNPYVLYDYVSVPYDSNFQKKNDTREPEGGTHFVQLGADRDADAHFKIDKEKTVYDVLKRTVSYQCEYTMNSTNKNLAFSNGGGRTIFFTVTAPMEGYLYNDAKNMRFDRTPSKDPQGKDLWKWNPLSENDPNYRDGIYWTLGKPMKASDLPKMVSSEGKAIKLFWDLNAVNINRATDSRGYTVTGYYYNADSIWTSVNLIVYIEKENVANKFLNAVGGSIFTRPYDGRYYHLPLDINAIVLKMLREDGTLASLKADAVIVEYKIAGADDRTYSTTGYPLNSGNYEIRIRVEDYNVKIDGELIIKLNITAMPIHSVLLVFENDNNGYITYTYDGKEKPLTITAGLPMVAVDNWFATAEEKNKMVQKHLNDGYSEVIAKSRAYNDLYRRVTLNTKSYMDTYKKSVGDSTGVTSDEELKAIVFDRLPYNMEIVEVKYRVRYINAEDKELPGAPVSVGIYTAVFEISSVDNSGNYAFDVERISKRLEIKQPEVVYSVTNTQLNYTGRGQNPRINGLHDANGNLPSGDITVTYRYTYTAGGVTHEIPAGMGLVDVGDYRCDITIDGGANYPNQTLQGIQISILPQQLTLDIETARSPYLSDIVDVGKSVKFNGLVGTDKPSVFGKVDAETDAKSYFTLGQYHIQINGFLVEGASMPYTYFNAGQSYEIDGKMYYKLLLKSADMEGSLYKFVDSAGSYIYKDIITKFTNYEIYIETAGMYEIYAEDDAVVITSDDELQSALAGLKNGQNIKLYLSAIYNSDGSLAQYSPITLSADAVVSIVGCYDMEKNILTYLGGVNIVRGSLTLRILGLTVEQEGDTLIKIGDDASLISIIDCILDGDDVPYATAVSTSMGYGGKVYLASSTVRGFNSGVYLTGGNMELENVHFLKNRNAVTILSNGLDVRTSNCRFEENGVGIYSIRNNTTIINNVFSFNEVGVKQPTGKTADLRANNRFGTTNAVDIDENL